jgi:hypothetical protein
MFLKLIMAFPENLLASLAGSDYYAVTPMATFHQEAKPS